MVPIIVFWLSGWGAATPLVPFRIFVAGKRVSVFLAGPPQ